MVKTELDKMFEALPEEDKVKLGKEGYIPNSSRGTSLMPDFDELKVYAQNVSPDNAAKVHEYLCSWWGM